MSVYTSYVLHAWVIYHTVHVSACQVGLDLPALFSCHAVAFVCVFFFKLLPLIHIILFIIKEETKNRNLRKQQLI